MTQQQIQTRTFVELDDAEKEQAQEVALQDIERMRTPWFIAERLMKDETVAESLRGMAQCDAFDALYPTSEARIIRLPS